jgi:hypothetical protein
MSIISIPENEIQFGNQKSRMVGDNDDPTVILRDNDYQGRFDEPCRRESLHNTAFAYQSDKGIRE